MPELRLTDDMLARSITSRGDSTRLHGVIDKATRGQSIRIGVIGGSITQWVKASEPRYRYANQLAAWFETQFPRTPVRLINAGRGATGSNYASLRASRDLLCQRPDLVVLEFAVNDGKAESSGETIEGLLRQVLRQSNRPAVLMLFMMRNGGDNAQERLASVGDHYSIPMASYRDALWPEIEAGRMIWADISPDEVHPNDAGHTYAAKLLIHLMTEVLKQAPCGADRVAVESPIYTDIFEHTTLFEATDLKPVESTGWWLDAHGEPWPCWVSDRPSSSITFHVTGQRILLMFYRQRGGFGRAMVKVDDLPESIHDGWFDQTWGGYRETVQIASNLEDKQHRVSVRLLPDRAKESSGNEFRILGLGAAGVSK